VSPLAAPAIDKVGPRPNHFRSGPTTGPTTRPGSVSPEVMRRVWGVVGSLVITLLKIYCWVCRWKNFEDRLSHKTWQFTCFGPLCMRGRPTMMTKLRLHRCVQLSGHVTVWRCRSASVYIRLQLWGEVSGALVRYNASSCHELCQTCSQSTI